MSCEVFASTKLHKMGEIVCIFNVFKGWATEVVVGRVGGGGGGGVVFFSGKFAKPLKNKKKRVYNILSFFPLMGFPGRPAPFLFLT